MSQKRSIKNDYLKKKQTESSLSMISKAKSSSEFKAPLSAHESKLQKTNREDTRFFDSGLESRKTSAITAKSSRQDFFPKSIYNLRI